MATKLESEELTRMKNSELWQEGVWKGRQEYLKKEKDRLFGLMPWLGQYFDRDKD